MAPLCIILPVLCLCLFPGGNCSRSSGSVPPGQAVQGLLLRGEGKANWGSVKPTESCGGWPVLDVAPKQSSGGGDTGLTVTLLAVCCLLACQNLGVPISNIPKVWGCSDLAVVSRTGPTSWGHWHSSGLYQSICLAQGMFHQGDAEIHMGQIVAQLTCSGVQLGSCKGLPSSSFVCGIHCM